MRKHYFMERTNQIEEKTLVRNEVWDDEHNGYQKRRANTYFFSRKARPKAGDVKSDPG